MNDATRQINHQYDEVNLTLNRTQALVSFLIAGTTADYEPDLNEFSNMGIQIQQNLYEAQKDLDALHEAIKAKTESEGKTERVTTPESEDIHKMMNISEEIDKIKDEGLKTSLRIAYIKFAKPYLGREFGFIEKPETNTEAES